MLAPPGRGSRPYSGPPARLLSHAIYSFRTATRPGLYVANCAWGPDVVSSELGRPRCRHLTSPQRATRSVLLFAIHSIELRGERSSPRRSAGRDRPLDFASRGLSRRPPQTLFLRRRSSAPLARLHSSIFRSLRVAPRASGLPDANLRRPSRGLPRRPTQSVPTGRSSALFPRLIPIFLPSPPRSAEPARSPRREPPPSTPRSSSPAPPPWRPSPSPDDFLFSFCSSPRRAIDRVAPVWCGLDGHLPSRPSVDSRSGCRGNLAFTQDYVV